LKNADDGEEREIETAKEKKRAEKEKRVEEEKEKRRRWRKEVRGRKQRCKYCLWWGDYVVAVFVVAVCCFFPESCSLPLLPFPPHSLHQH
jgi:hypothetical protein